MSTFMDTLGNRSSEIGDYIGTESCTDLNDIAVKEKEDVKSPNKVRPNTTDRRQRREFPPPIPLLARTENLLPHMPWTLRRYYSGDGRLIIKEVRVPHHDYFRVNRSGGRLTLDLVPLDDEIPPLGLDIQDEGIEEGNVDAVVELADEEEQLMNQAVAMVVVEEDSEIRTQDSPEIEEKSKQPIVAGKCWNYSGIQFSSCLVPSIRQVQI